MPRTLSLEVKQVGHKADHFQAVLRLGMTTFFKAVIWNISPFYLYYSITFNPSTPGPSMRSLPFRFPHQTPVWASLLTHACHMPNKSHPSWFHDINMWGGEQTMQLPSCSFLQPHYSSLLGPNIFLITILSDILSPCSSLNALSLSLALQPWVGLGLLFP